MKKHHQYSISIMRCISFILLFFAVGNVYGANTQKSYSSRDEIYERVALLSLATGNLPPAISPVSGEMLLTYLDKIDREKLSYDLRNELDKLYEEITEGNSIYRDNVVDLSLGMEVNLFFNIADYKSFDFSHKMDNELMKDRRNENIEPFRLTKAFLEGEAGVYFSDYVALEGTLMVGNNNHHMYESSLGWLVNSYNGKLINVFSYEEDDESVYILEFPYKAGLSAGNSFFSFILGRYPHSYGSFRSGNLTIGDNFKYQEIAQISLFSQNISYYMSLTRFDQQINHGIGELTSFSRNKFSGNQQYRIVHRIEGTILDRIRLSLDLGTLYNTDNGFDLRFFQPFMIQHNYGNYTNTQQKEYFDEANNILALTADISLGLGWILSAEFLLDQLQVGFEDQESVPPSYGFAVAITNDYPLKSGILDTYLEGVYTNPYLYLNGKRDIEGVLDYNLDYVVGYNSEFLDEYGYSGYIYGPDTIALSMGAAFHSYKNDFSIEGAMLYRIQGMNTIRHIATGNYETYIDMTHASFDKDYALFSPSCSLDIAEHMIEAKLSSKLSIGLGVSFFLGAQLNLYWNYENNPDLDWIIRPQGRVGVSWSI